MKRQHRWFEYVYLVGLIATTAMIVIFSSFSADVSSTQSSTLLDVITGLFTWLNIHLTVGQIETIHHILRKMIGHFGLFFVHGVFAYLTSYYWLSYTPRTKLVFALGLGLFIAGLSEFIQLFAPERGPSIIDVIIDFTGTIIGVFIVILIQIGVNSRQHIKKA